MNRIPIMSRLNTDKLTVEFREGVTSTEPIVHRRYTLTHSDITAELFLTIGLEYAYDKINFMRDEVYGEWTYSENSYIYYAYVLIDGEFSPEVAAIRNYIFRRELPLALEAIRYGDNGLFVAHPWLDDSPIYIHFMSSIPEYNKVEYWGTFSDYRIEN